MPDFKKRLKQRALERWENEGGKIKEADLPRTQKSDSRDHGSKVKRSAADNAGVAAYPPTTTAKRIVNKRMTKKRS